MANNRMWLLHKPSGKAVMLGKRYNDGWYSTHENLFYKVNNLFVTAGSFSDDFTLAMEDCSGAKSAFDKWEYTKEPSVLKVKEQT